MIQTLSNFQQILKIINPDLNIQEFDISKLKHELTILFIYPKDGTPGCTIESCGIRDIINEYSNVLVDKSIQFIGYSKDSQKSHERFIKAHNLNFPIVIDEEASLAIHLEVYKEKSMFGKKYMGLERSTFVIDKMGNIIKEWRDVNSIIHKGEIVEFISNYLKLV